MPRRSTLGPRETDFLKERLDDYIAAQGSRQVPRFLNHLYAEYFERFPLSIDDSSEGADYDPRVSEQAARVCEVSNTEYVLFNAQLVLTLCDLQFIRWKMYNMFYARRRAGGV